ncbi:hypothetical protein FOH24_13920 [Acetobacter tropicalis]|uniref:Uncharacterized protein n=1 Tax=Acetobacter tropicalis TaxID=104102 RepID=A0A094YI45_9PROT|nr:hypothetical protein [Acetobacter tropicalis]KAA8387364.1 hypothetical protein FOH24_13920 [Acetobacter tropicalis]KAA8387523.1 hypothetical protein FOH22_09375 [Acetobacter tropicalis]KGB21012.1 hypothetical protein AtDm6_3377 [Acetobacter tropicalis]MBC9010093.1 hypothetical protein [Acetobacter tropicalis]MDO8170971.1 hypothetical protein [Acetobacter tropicalis]
MKFFPLIETAPGSGKFLLASAAVEAASTTAALALIAPSVGAGLRYGAWLNREVRGLPTFTPAPAEETGKSYKVLAEIGGADQPFILTGSVQTSLPFDASLMCLAMQQGANFRYGLMPVDEQPVASPESTSGTESSGTPASS